MNKNQGEYHVEFANEFLTAYAFSKLNGILLDGCGRIDMQYLPRSDEERFQTKENANIGAEIAKDMISRHPELYMDNKPPRSAKCIVFSLILSQFIHDFISNSLT